MTQASLQSFFSGGKGKYAKFENIGDKITGKILAVHPPEDATDPNGKVKTDKNGRALQQIRIELETDLRSEEIEYDDGVRTLYVQSYMIDAVKDALRRAGTQVPEVGATLTVEHNEKVANPGLRDSKKYHAEYVAPSSSATSEFFGGGTGLSAPGLPDRPTAISETAWQVMDKAQKRKVAETMNSMGADQPPF